MARLLRYVLPGQPQHVILRGNNCRIIFNVDGDYRFYLEKLNEACKKQKLALERVASWRYVQSKK